MRLIKIAVPQKTSIVSDRINSENENNRSALAQPAPTGNRLLQRLGPILGGLLIDGIDLASYGPLGIGGLLVGAFAAWWLTSGTRLNLKTRIFVSAITGIYCLTPFTEILPLATIVATIGKFLRKSF